MIEIATTPSLSPSENGYVQKVERSITALQQWVEKNGYRAYDPGDGNNSFLHLLTFNNLLLERVLQQAVYRAPFNLRPLLGIRPHISTKGMGYMAWGYAKMYRSTGDPVYEKKTRFCLDWLIRNRSESDHYCWGNNFSFSTRAGKIPKHEPTIVWSSLIGMAFVEASRTLGDSALLDVAASTCRWILSLPLEKTGSGDCISYVAFKQSSIHNSNMLGAALLGVVGSQIDDQQMLDRARQAMRYSCTRQRPDGSWFYGEGAKYHWIDNFHTGYNLDSLRRYLDATGDTDFKPQLIRGFDFFQKTFFEADGCPRYYHNQKYPIDIQCAAQAIDTLTFFSDLDDQSLDLARKVANWTIDHMQARDGHFYYRDMGWAVNKTPMLHWGQGTMFKALAHLLAKIGARDVPSAQSQNGDHAAPPQHGIRATGLKYVLITAARNEEDFIENTIQSVIAQTRPPQRWIIVSDGSTDRTDEIVSSYARRHSWIEAVRMPERSSRQFAGKADAFNAGYARLSTVNYDIIGNLDADISFEPDYLQFLLNKFGENPNLGVAGTPFVENSEKVNDHSYAHRFAQLEHVSGACQLFRKTCFDQIGGYKPIKEGGIDWIAVTTARMKGWQTRTFVDKFCHHHRRLGTGNDHRWIVFFRYGQKAYSVGGHPIWELLRGVFQMRRRPFIIGGLVFQCGFLWAALTGMKRKVSPELLRFHRQEQMHRLRNIFSARSQTIEARPN